MARKLVKANPPGKLMFTDEGAYFVAKRRPPRGMEFGYSHKLKLPPEKLAALHITPESELQRELAAGVFASAATCDNDTVDTYALEKCFSTRRICTTAQSFRIGSGPLRRRSSLNFQALRKVWTQNGTPSKDGQDGEAAEIPASSRKANRQRASGFQGPRQKSVILSETAQAAAAALNSSGLCSREYRTMACRFSSGVVGGTSQPVPTMWNFPQVWWQRRDAS